jgi:hypothetical protein
MTITKEAALATYSAVGNVISYKYNVTNTGNVVITGLTVTDDKATVTLDKNTIQPGESANGTATYAITQQDIDAGSVTNIANATGTYDGNKPVKSNDATATVTKIASTGQICPTQTTCGQYMSGTAAVLTKASYNSKTGTIKSVFPGVMFYYSTIISDGTVMTISVDQSNSGGWPVMAI